MTGELRAGELDIYAGKLTVLHGRADRAAGTEAASTQAELVSYMNIELSKTLHCSPLGEIIAEVVVPTGQVRKERIDCAQKHSGKSDADRARISRSRV